MNITIPDNTAKILKFETIKKKGWKGSKKPPVDSTTFTKGFSKDTMKNLTKTIYRGRI